MVLILVLGLAGCGVTPEQLGITGPGDHKPLPPVMPDDATLQTPGLPTTGNGVNSGQRYYGYN